MNTMTMDRVNTLGCICGAEMVYKEGTITRNIKGKEIHVHNVPHFECPDCGERAFDLNIRLSSLVVKAYKDGISDIIYQK
jgi:YgiT-type zinc finger domain-containing protein